MRFNATRVIAALVAAATAAGWSAAQMPDRPLITEVYTDAPGGNDGPVGRNASNAHQEFLEIYIPRLQDLERSCSPRRFAAGSIPTTTASIRITPV